MENGHISEHRQASSPDDGASPRRQYKTVNGKKHIDMTPPDQLLSTAQKRARKLSVLRKVRLNTSAKTHKQACTYMSMCMCVFLCNTCVCMRLHVQNITLKANVKWHLSSGNILMKISLSPVNTFHLCLDIERIIVKTRLHILNIFKSKLIFYITYGLKRCFQRNISDDKCAG